MQEGRGKILEALRAAIQAEIEGQHFYIMASRTTQDPMGREVFERLAKDEIEHERFLRANYRSIMETGKTDSTTKLGTATEFAGSSPIFSPALKARIKDAHFEMTALSIGMQLEAGAVTFYRNAAQQAQDPEVRNFFLALASWEHGHYTALMSQQDVLKQDYWSSQGFSPM